MTSTPSRPTTLDVAAAAGRALALACAAPSLRAFRRRALDLVAELVPHDAALFHALSPRVPLETAVLRGIPRSAVAATRPRWDGLADLLSPLRERASRSLAATDAVLPRATRRRLEAEVLAPLGVRSVCVVHLVVRRRVQAVIVLFARAPRAFTAAHLQALRALAPTLALGDTVHRELDGLPSASPAARLVCRDQRLTPRQRQLVERVALGHTNAEIARALELSVHAVRNHLARAFGRVGANNRADLVRRAVLTPETGR